MIDESNSQRHHFALQFYLREWYMPGCDLFLLYGRDTRNQLYSRSRPSKSVGFESDLKAAIYNGLLVNQKNKHLVSSRALVDGACIKYKKMAESMLCTNHSVLRGVKY